MATVTGNSGNDFIHRLGDGRVAPVGFEDVTGVTIGDDAISGNGGNDYIFGDNGDDVIVGDSYDDDFEYYGTGDDYIFGGDGRDTINGGNGYDVIDGGADNDAIHGGDGDDLIDGGAGDDVIDGDYTYRDTRYYYGNGNDHIKGGYGRDIINGGDGDDEIDGGAGDDVITGDYYDRVDEKYHDGDDYIFGGDGNDVIDGGGGTDTLAGGAGDDTYLVTYDSFEGVIIEEAGGGIDTVKLRIYFEFEGDAIYPTYHLPDPVENLSFSGPLGMIGYGNEEDNTVTSTQGANQLYGLGGDDTLHSGSGVDRLDGGIGSDAMYGGAGNDTYEVDDADDTVHEDAIGGVDLVESTVTYTLAANVEKLTLLGASALDGTGNDIANTLTGNGVANVLSGLDGNDRLYGLDGDDTLYGGAGNDRLDGGIGSDAMYGGAGNDTYEVDNAGDTVHEDAIGGVDLVESTVTYTLAANVEKLTLMGTAAINGTGNALGNTLVGNAAANVLDGGAGADSMSGGAGDDTYIVDQAGDEISEVSVGGTDTVLASASYVLGGQYIERLTLTGMAAVDATGNALANMLTGNGAANRLDGKAGSDEMRGGAGDDTYVVDQAGDRVYERNGEGIDTVLSSVSYDLAGQYIENLTLAGTSAINGTGNSLANILVGNAAANRLDGMAGKDEMRGGKGDDIYIVSQAGDEAYESNNQGIDTVLSSVSYDLAGQYIEKLTLTGTAAINATGNSLANILVGNAAANRLDGMEGIDEMRGGRGNDTYVVGQAGDKAYERNEEGTDTVLSSVSYDLAGQYIENLTLTGRSAIDGTGNSLDNALVGNSAANVLDGRAGNDILRGNGGNDIFSFSGSPALVADPDIIRDFSNVSGNDDSIRLDHHAFIALSATPMLSAAAFKDLALGAKDSSDRIVYDSTRGNLYYDADGSGSIQAVKFAHLDNHATLTNADFSVI